MADIYDNRRARLRLLIDERFQGNQSRLDKAIRITGEHICCVLHGVANLGESGARQFEAALGLPDGWFDREPPPGAVPKTPYKARMGRPPIQDGIVRPKRKPKRPLLSLV